MRRLSPALVAVAATAFIGVSGFPQPRAMPVTTAPGAAPPRPVATVVVEHRYRIIGKVRLAVVWASRDDVGSARMTWRDDGTTSTLALLAGSNPEHAPRNLNEWSYLREELRSDRAEVFTLRSLGSEEITATAPAVVADGSMFGVSCSSIDERDVLSAQTTVSGRGATYWMFDRLLEQIVVARSWQARRMARPAGAAAGFLTALQQALRLGRSDARAVTSMPPLVYVYNNTLYDLRARESVALGRTKVGGRTFDRLIRTDFTVRNHATRDITQFRVTYCPDGEGTPLPVQIVFRPSFWMRVELRLDDAVNVPPDPAADGAVLSRIRAICANTINQ
jgi:hypothetical protein